MSRLRGGEWLAGAGGAALLLSLFLHWYGVGPFSVSAWRAFSVLDVVLAVLALVPLALVALQATRRSPALPVAFSTFTVLAGALATLLILYRILNQPGPNELVDVKPGAWLGLLTAALTTAGGWRSLRTEPVPTEPLPPVANLPVPAP
jgi:hypothetical protein